MDQLYSRTETPEAEAATSALRQEASGGGERPAGIMSALPHRRPHRRSALRRGQAPVVPVAAGAAAQAVAAAEPVEERHLRAVGEPPPAPVPAQRRSRRKMLPPPAEPAPGIGRLALDGAIETAKLPWRVAAELTRQAAGSISGTLRR